MSLAVKSLSIFLRDIFLFFSNAVVSIILARSLGPHALGLWFSLNLIPSYAELFGRIKIDAAAVYFLSKGKYSVQRLLPIINVIAIGSSALIILIYLAGFTFFNAYLFKEDALVMQNYVYLILLLIPLTFLYMNYLYIHIYREDKTVVNQMVLIRSFFSFVLIVSFFLYSNFSLSIIQVIIATITGVFAALFYGLVKSPKHSFLVLNPSFKAVKELLAYGYKLYIAGVFSYLNVYCVQFIVLLNLAPSAMSFYTIAQQNSQLFQKLADAVTVFLFPLIAKSKDTNDSIEITLKVFRVLIILLFPSLILAFIFLKYAVALTYGVKYLSVVIPILIILPFIVLSTATSPLSTLFQGLGKPHLAYRALIIPIVIQILLGWIIIPLWGIIGAAICFSIGCLFSAIMHLVILKREFGVKSLLNKLLIRKSDIKFVYTFISTLIKKALVFKSK